MLPPLSARGKPFVFFENLVGFASVSQFEDQCEMAGKLADRLRKAGDFLDKLAQTLLLHKFLKWVKCCDQ